MVTLAKELQFANAKQAIDLTEGMLTLTKELQFRKAHFPMWVTEFGIATCVKDRHSAKA